MKSYNSILSRVRIGIATALISAGAAMVVVAAKPGVRSSGVDPTEIAPTADNTIVNRSIPPGGSLSPAHVPAAFVPRQPRSRWSIQAPSSDSILAASTSSTNGSTPMAATSSASSRRTRASASATAYMLEAVNTVLAFYDASTGARSAVSNH